MTEDLLAVGSGLLVESNGGGDMLYRGQARRLLKRVQRDLNAITALDVRIGTRKKGSRLPVTPVIPVDNVGLNTAINNLKARVGVLLDTD